MPHTHPKPMSIKKRLTAWGILAVLAFVAAGIGYSVGLNRGPLGTIATPKQAATPKPTPTPTKALELAQARATTSTPAFVAAPAYDPAAADSARQQALSAYVTAYRAAAKKGFYPAVPPATTITSTDPLTASAYVISTKAPAAAAGQIRYWLGGACKGSPHTPGTTGSRYLALQIFQETSPTPYCLQVNL